MGGKRKIRLGINVGSLFTTVAAVDADSSAVIARLRILTTRHHPRGIAEGIIQAIRGVARDGEFDPADVVFTAFGTTEPANMILEGDRVLVGIVELGPTRSQRVNESTSHGSRERGAGSEEQGARSLEQGAPCTMHHAPCSTLHAFVDTSRGLDSGEITKSLYHLRSQGARAIVAADRSGSPAGATQELSVVAAAHAIGLPACGTHQLSRSCPVKDRARIAAVNASALPTVIRTAEMADMSRRESRIAAPLLIMRNDGGLTTIDAARSRPLIVLLSGPAAAATGAVSFAGTSDGVFLNIGETSTSISVIKQGRVISDDGEIGDHRLGLKSVATRTVGVGGGSMIRLRRGAIGDIGPRSASGAGLPRAVASDLAGETGLRLCITRPTSDDPEDYAVVETASGNRYAVTVSCAAALLAEAMGQRVNESTSHGSREHGAGSTEQGARSRERHAPCTTLHAPLPHPESARIAFGPLAARLAMRPEDAAELVMERAIEKLAEAVLAVMRQHQLDKTTVLVGGGGAAPVCLPLLADKLRLSFQIVDGAEFLGAVGLALAKLQESVEITIANPSDSDLARLRQQTEAAVLRMGAKPDTLTTAVEIDRHLDIVRVTTSGIKDSQIVSPAGPMVAPDQRFRMAADAMKVAEDQVELVAETTSFEVYVGRVRTKKLFGFLKGRTQLACVCDKEGVIRLTLGNAQVMIVKAAEALDAVKSLLKQQGTEAGSEEQGAGGLAHGAQCSMLRAPRPMLPAPCSPPRLFLVHGSKITDLCGLARSDQILALAEMDLRGLDKNAPVIVLAEIKT